MSANKKKLPFQPKRKIIVPRGTVNPDDVAIIELPQKLQRNAVCIAERKEDDGPSCNHYYARPSGTSIGFESPAACPGATLASSQTTFATAPCTATATPSCPAVAAQTYNNSPAVTPSCLAVSAPSCPLISQCYKHQQGFCPGAMAQPIQRPIMMTPIAYLQQIPTSQVQQQPPQQPLMQGILFYYNPQVPQICPGFSRAPQCPGAQLQCPGIQRQSPGVQFQSPEVQSQYPRQEAIQPSAATPNVVYTEPVSSAGTVPPTLSSSRITPQRQSPRYVFSPEFNLQYNDNQGAKSDVNAAFYGLPTSNEDIAEKERAERDKLERDLSRFQDARRRYLNEASTLTNSSAAITATPVPSVSPNKTRNESWVTEYDDDDFDYNDTQTSTKSKSKLKIKDLSVNTSAKRNKNENNTSK